ncbi:hypothetical protein GW864_03335 [bacterium]|nr:hypothetical protein [bacterium]
MKEDEIADFIKKNLEKIKKNHPKIRISDENILLASKLGNGDLRNSLNVLESAIMMKGAEVQRGKGAKDKYDEKDEQDKCVSLTDQDILSAGQKSVYYDRDSEEHYNIISAVHKSLRDGDGDAACYWIQRMLMGGEDPLYICRRLMRFASEDI